MFGSRSRRVVVGLAAGLLMATAACSSGGGAQNTPARRRSGTAADSPRMTFAMISHAPEGDAFFDVIKKGAQEAADKDNVEFKYSSSGEVPDQSTFIQNAIDSKVDGIAVSLPDPDALAPVIQKAVAAGIPVVAFNAGDRAWQKTGALAFYGEPEVLAGEFAGTKLNELGSTHTLCVLQAQGQVQLEDRCAGIASKFGGQTEKLYANGTDTPQYVSTVSAKLRQDPASTPSSPSARRWASRCSSSSSRTAARPRSSPMRSTTTCSRCCRTARSPSPSTSSPTCRATCRSTRCGSTRRTRASSAPSSRSRPARSSSTSPTSATSLDGREGRPALSRTHRRPSTTSAGALASAHPG